MTTYIVFSNFLDSVLGYNNITESFGNWLARESTYAEALHWIILFALLLFVCMIFFSRDMTTRMFSSISKRIFTISACVWFIGVFIYIIGFYKDDLHWLAVIPRAVISSFRMFVVANELARVDSNLQKDAIYMIIFSITHFTAAFITFLFIFKMLGHKTKSSFKMLKHKLTMIRNCNVHVFWGVNEASYLLAKDIHEKHATDTIIFIDIDKKSEDGTPKQASLNHITNTITIKESDIERLEGIGALIDHCYNGPASLDSTNNTDVFGALKLRSVRSIVKRSARPYFYLMAKDENQNITSALNLQQDKTLQSLIDKEPVIFVRAHKDANNEIFDHYSQYDGETRRITVKIVDSVELAMNNLKESDKSLPVKCVRIDKNTGAVDTPFTSLIVGFGSMGQEAFKFLYEFSAFVGSDHKRTPFKCYAIDEKMDKIEGLARSEMPAIKEDELELIKASANSNKFWETINSIIGKLNYIIVATDNDNLNLSVAVNIFKCALKNRSRQLPMLKILIRCNDNSNETLMCDVENNLNNSTEGGNAELIVFAKDKDIYNYNLIFRDVHFIKAKEFNNIYEGKGLSDDIQWKNNFGKEAINKLMKEKKISRYHAIQDINRRIEQNFSNSLHSKTKMILMGFDSTGLQERLKMYYGYTSSRKDKTTKYNCDDLDKKLLLNAAMVEHERWNASHKLMGYTYAKEKDLVQRHHCYILPWDDIDDETQSYDCKVVDTTIKEAYMSTKK